MPKFFYTHNVKKAPQGFEFIQSEFFAPTSSYIGIYATEVPAEIEKLSKAPGVKEISQDEFEKFWVKSQSNDGLTIVKMKTFMTPEDGKLTGRPAEVRAPSAAPAPVSVEDILTPAPSLSKKK